MDHGDYTVQIVTHSKIYPMKDMLHSRLHLFEIENTFLFVRSRNKWIRGDTACRQLVVHTMRLVLHGVPLSRFRMFVPIA